MLFPLGATLFPLVHRSKHHPKFPAFLDFVEKVLQNVANFVDCRGLILGRVFCKCPWPGEGGRERELLPLHV
jgi:hypothetical protein